MRCKNSSHQNRRAISAIPEKGSFGAACTPLMMRQSPVPVSHSPLHSQRARFTGIFPKRYSESTLTLGISSRLTERGTESH